VFVVLTKSFNISKLNITITFNPREFACPIAFQNYIGNFKYQNMVVQIGFIFIDFKWELI
jgi:hypothetical protein